MEQNCFKQFKIGAKINRESRTPKSEKSFTNIPKIQNSIESVVDTTVAI